jgi:glycosyltransferase involved in cell wall biosynthesis
MTTELLQIYILSRDREEYLRIALNSALDQEPCAWNVEVIVSDNSITDAVRQMMIREFPQVKYVRRDPPMDSADHFKKVISEASADFVVLFHDDDILMPSYCRVVQAKFAEQPGLSAVGTNAYIVNKSRVTKRLMNSHKQDKIIENVGWLLNQYIPRPVVEKGIAPFPSYCYRRSPLKAEYPSEITAGKYQDVQFIAHKIRYGPILWVKQPLMGYRIHGQNDSSKTSIEDYLKLWRYMGRMEIDTKSEHFRSWKLMIWLAWYLELKQGSNRRLLILPESRKERVVQEAILMGGFPIVDAHFLKKFLRFAFYSVIFLNFSMGWLIWKIRSLGEGKIIKNY